MTAVKLSSTNQLNKEQALTACPVTFTLSRIGGRWKPLIIFHLTKGAKRYGQLKKAIPSISEKMLIQNLKELAASKLIFRKAMQVVPPHVEYSLTSQGQELLPILGAMCTWAEKYNV